MQCASGAGANGLIDRDPVRRDDQRPRRARRRARRSRRSDPSRTFPSRRRTASPRRPSASGRKPCGSRTAISRSLVSITSENAPCTCADRLDDRVLDAPRLRPRVEVEDDLGVAVRLEDRALLDEIVAQLVRVDDVAVVAERDLAVRAVDQDRLGVQQLALAGGRVAHVADRHAGPAAPTASRRRRCRRRSPSPARCAPAAPSDAAMPALSCPRCCSAYRPR